MCNRKKSKAAIALMLVLTLLLTGCKAAYADPDTANRSPVTDNDPQVDNPPKDDIQEKPGTKSGGEGDNIGDVLPKISDNPGTNQYPEDPAVLQAYLSVLEGSRKFDCLGVGDLKIDQLNQVENSLGDGAVTVTKLAVLDMDSDAAPEVALELKADNNAYYGFLLLDCRWDTVYGYFLNYRGFMDLKTDGTFHWSSGAAKNGYSKLRFADNGYVPNDFIYTTSHQDAQGNTLVSYYADHKSVTEAEFRQACAQQDAKEAAMWHAFTEENLKVLFGTNDKPAEQPGHSTPITSYIEALFPPKGSTIIMEGYIVEIPIVAGGREPVIGEDGTCKPPGFAIYYDPALFYMTEENGNVYIRGIPVSYPGKEDFYANLPPTEIEIRYIPNVAPAVDAEAVRNEMLGSYQTVSEPAAMQNGKDVYLNFSNGTNWDSPCGDIKFFSDGRGGTFRITSRYFLEASECAGIRFSNMVSTFTVIDPQAQSKS